MQVAKANRPSLALVQWGSFRAFPVGGITTFVESILPHLSRAFDVKLVGMSMGERLGRWTALNIDGRSYDFLPIVGRKQSRAIPDRIRLAYGIARYRRELLAMNVRAYYVHMTEAALPLLFVNAAPVVIHVHGLYNLFQFSRHCLGKPFAIVYDHLYPFLFKRCAKVLGAGTDEEFELFRSRMRVRDGKALPTCVREDVFFVQDKSRAREELGIGRDDVLLLYVGRLTDTKNPLLLIEVERILRHRIPRLKVCFVGDGPLRANIEAAVKVNGNVIVAGRLSSAQTALWMAAADALTVVSKTEAFTSIAALEALSCGLPVVATPVSALPKLLAPKVNGRVSDDYTAEAYACALESLLVAPPTRQSCAASVAAYTSSEISQQIIAELDQVVTSAQSH